MCTNSNTTPAYALHLQHVYYLYAKSHIVITIIIIIIVSKCEGLL